MRGVLAAPAHGMRGPVNRHPGEITVLDLARLVVILIGSDSEIRFIERPTDDPASSWSTHEEAPYRVAGGSATSAWAGRRSWPPTR